MGGTGNWRQPACFPFVDGVVLTICAAENVKGQARDDDFLCAVTGQVLEGDVVFICV